MAGARLFPVFLSLAVAFTAARPSSAHPKAPRLMSDPELAQARGEISLTGPHTLLGVGGGLFVVGGSLVAIGVLSDAYGEDAGGKTELVLGSVFASTGVALAMVGGIWLDQRVKRRRSIDRELERRRSGAFQLRVLPLPLPVGAGLSVSGTF